MKYATVLLQNCPKECTEILIDFYTGKFKPTRDAVVVVTAPINSGTSLATTAVQNLAALIPLPYMNSSSDPKSEVAGKDTKVHAQVIQTNGDDPPAVYDIPDVKNAFPIFVNHVDEFIIFLEACSESGVTLSDENSDLHTTLFEMYLRKAGESGDGEKEQWEARAKRLIEDGKV